MDIFLKGLVHRFCPKIELFFYGRFLQKSYQETSFLILQKEKNDFKQKKNGGLKKSQKMDIFQRGQSMDFVQKSKFLVWVFCTEILSEKMVFSYFGQKTNIVRIKNWSFNKGQKMNISKGVSPWILSKNRNFSFSCFSRKLCHKKSPLNILNKKQSFLDQKMEVLTRAKKWTFSKGVSPWILSKNRNFSYGCFVQKLGQKKWFLVILDRKQTL